MFSVQARMKRPCDDAFPAPAQKRHKIDLAHECLQESTGFNNAFPFLRLPREIRDEIYTYTLDSDLAIDIAPSPPFFDSNISTNRPLTPGLLRTNKQIHHEAVEILYSKRTFYFNSGANLFAFEEQIGSDNRAHVKNLDISIEFPREYEKIPDPTSIPVSKYGEFLSHWIAALKQTRLDKILHLTIRAYMKWPDDTRFLDMPPDLQECIERLLGHLPHDNKVPRLKLMGFKNEELLKFPNTWRLSADRCVHRTEYGLSYFCCTFAVDSVLEDFDFDSFLTTP